MSDLPTQDSILITFFFSFCAKIRIFFPMMTKVAVAILREDGKTLLCQRKKSARYALKWEFPGGKVENNESAVACLKRELKEELGIEAEVGDLFFRQEYTYSDSGSFEILYYLVRSYRPMAEGLRDDAFEQIRWIPENQLNEIDLLEGNREVVKLLTQQTTPISAPRLTAGGQAYKGGDERGGRL